MIDELIDCIASLDDQICSDSWYGWVKSKPHPSFMRRAMASSFEMEELCMVFCIKRPGMHNLVNSFSAEEKRVTPMIFMSLQFWKQEW